MARQPREDNRQPHAFSRDVARVIMDEARRYRGELTDPHADPQVPTWENSDVRLCMTPTTGIPARTTTGSTGSEVYTPGKADCDIYFGGYDVDTGDRALAKADGDKETLFNLLDTELPGDTLMPVVRVNDGTLLAIPLSTAPALWVKNYCGSTRAQYELLQTSTPEDSPIVPNRIRLRGDTPAVILKNFAVLQKETINGAFGPATMSGLTLAQVYVGSTLHRRAYVVAGEYRFTSGFAGPARILWAPGTNLQTCLIQLECGESVQLDVKTPSGGIPPATYVSSSVTPGTATCDVWRWDGAKIVPFVDGSTQLTVSVDSYAPVAIPGSRLAHVFSDEAWRFRMINPFCTDGWAV